MPRLQNFHLDVVCDDLAETLYSALKACWDADGYCGTVTHYAIEPDSIVLYWEPLNGEATCRPLPFKMDLGAAIELIRSWLRSDPYPIAPVPAGTSSLNRLAAYHVQKDGTDLKQVAVRVRRVWGIYEPRECSPAP